MGVPGAGEGAGSECLMGTEFHSGKMGKVLEMMVVMVVPHGEYV